MLQLPVPIAAVAFLPDPLLPERLDEKTIIIDVQATDAEGRVFQVEMQASAEPHFAARAVVGLAGLVRRRVKRGAPYTELRPGIALWICDEDVLPASPDAAGRPRHLRRFGLADLHSGEALTDLGGLVVVELDRLRRARGVAAPVPKERWQRFLATPTLETAMVVLQSYTEDDVKQRLYERRMEALRIERTREADAARLRAENARVEEARARAEDRCAQAEEENERLRALLRSLGHDLPG